MRSIRNQLLMYLVPGVLLLAIAAGIGLYSYMEEVLERGLDAELAAKAQVIAGAIHMEDDGQPHLQMSTVDAVAATRRESPFFFQVWRGNGQTLARVVPAGSGAAAIAIPPHQRKFGDERLPDGTPARAAFLSFAAQPDEDAYDAGHQTTAVPLERLTLVVAHDRRSIDGPLTVLLSGLSFTTIVFAAGMVAFVTWGVRRSLRPLDEVARLVDRVAPESMDVQLPTRDSLPAELQPIGQKLNELLDRLAAGFERERQFSAAVAHELRTPLAELRSACEVALAWPDDRDASTAAHIDALAIAREMGKMVQNLLALARGQSLRDVLEPSPISLANAVSDAWAGSSVVAKRRGLLVDVQLPPDIMVRSDPTMFNAVLRNILDNAVEHATPAGRVSVRAERNQNATVCLYVGNTCDALSLDDRLHLFEPFWRKSTARTGGTHAGLGLSIVRMYCRAMDVPVTVVPSRPDWFEISILLPSSAEASENMTAFG